MDDGNSNSLLRRMRRFFLEKEEKNRTAEELIEKIEEGYEQGVIPKRELTMLDNIFGYIDEDVKDIMTHRKNIVAIDGDVTLRDALDFILEETYSRFPVYEGDIDRIIGRVHMRDVMRCYLKEELRDRPLKELRDILRPVTFVPETRGIDKLLQQMQRSRVHMVVVVDEYGETAGVVTMEDIIEEIVGNIQDEYDEEEEQIVRQKDGSYVVDGMAELEDLERLLSVTFDEEDYDTLNGYLIARLDRIPGEEEHCAVQFGGYEFRVLSVDNNMIRKVSVKKTEKTEET